MQISPTKTSKEKAYALREKAEELAGQNPLFLMRHAPEEVQALVHELYVYQIELEAQNDELRRVQHELIETRSDFADFFDAAPVAYLTTDLDGRIDRINLAACEFLNGPRRDLVMKPLRQFISPAYRETYDEFTQRIRREKQHSTARIKLRRKNDPDPYVQLAGAPVYGKKGEMSGIAITFTDISDFDGQAAKQDSGRPAIEGHAALVRIARCIAHDFNNLLSVILGNAQEQLAKKSGLNEETQHALKDIHQAAVHLARITDQLHAFAGRNIIHYRCVPLSQIVDELKDELAAALPGTCTLNIASGGDSPRTRVVDGQIAQVLRNLVRNAAESGKDRCEVSVNVGAHYCDETFLQQAWAIQDTPPGQYAFIEVNDNGSGIPTHALPHIFEPFFTTKPANNGMGLAEVFGTVTSHHGFITVDTEGERGTRIRCYFPAATEENAPPRAEQRPKTRKETATILVVDDNPQVLAVTKRRLEMLNYQVISHLSGRDALVTLENVGDQVDVAIIDVEMPGLNGIETFDRMRQIRSDIRALFTSGYTDEILGAMDKDPRVEFIGKPYRNEELTAKIDALLER
jgi:two-component system, cell cycle sensor histidine kinase and response regulator CckA